MNASNVKTYYRLTKPGIVYGNTMVALAACVYASAHVFSAPIILGMLVGIMCSIASVCVINNILDKDIDMLMERTKKRAIPTGTITPRNAYIFAALLFVIGTGSLYFFTNPLTLAITLLGDIVYIALYTPLKRVTHHSTIIGAIAGATPPLIGYTAVSHTIDHIAVVLFIFLIAWQMVHFMAIAIFRRPEYAAAGIPVMPVRFPILRSKLVMITYAGACVYAAIALFFIARVNIYLELAFCAVNALWLLIAFRGLRTHEDSGWAKRMFFYSIGILLFLCALLVLS